MGTFSLDEDRKPAYSVGVRYLGDWYDVESVIKGLNPALADSGRRERFVPLYTGDQTCTITFARDEEFRKVARELRLPLEDDYRAATRAGIAFERHVRNELEGDT